MSFKVVSIGEVLWDLLPSGPQLGGAPANFACHVSQFGAESQLITRVGTDLRGREIIRQLYSLGVRADLVQLDSTRSTGTVSVSLSDAGVPEYVIQENVAWDYIAATADTLTAVRAADAVCFGSLAQRDGTSAAAIQLLAASARTTALRVLDINLRPPFLTRETIERSLQIANVLKLNEHELAILGSVFDLSADVNRQIELLADRFELQVVALTKGDRGSVLYQSGAWSELPARPGPVVDTIGAGDAFTAALVMGLLYQFPLEDIHRLAADTAGHVCSCHGATPAMPESLRRTFLAKMNTVCRR